MRFLALLLFTPPFLILAWLYWRFPLALPRTPARRRYDVAVLLASVAATVVALLLAWDAPAPGSGPIWQQVLATLAVYHTFPLLLLIAWVVRARRFGR